MTQIDLVNKIQYQYNANSKNPYYTFGSLTMKATSNHLLEMILKDVGLQLLGV